MSLSSKVLSGAGLLSFSEGIVQICGLLRNIIIVRTLTQAEYGVAATFTLVVAMIDSAANMKVRGLLISASDGDEPEFQKASQLLNFVQGCLQGALIYILAPSFCSLFNVPGAEWQYRALALIPVIRGAAHFDMDRVQRSLNYMPTAKATITAQVLSLLAVLVLSQYVKDVTLVVWAATLRPAIHTIVTHITRERKYRWGFERGYIERLFRFGWPLLVNGWFMLVVSQGDRFLIGSAESLPKIVASLGLSWEFTSLYTKADLAVYTIAISLAALPAVFISKIVPSIFLPLFAKANRDPTILLKVLTLEMRIMTVVAAACATFFILLGSAATTFLYSDRYETIGQVIGLVGFASAIRILRMGQTVFAIAQTRTEIVLMANMSRCVALVGFATVMALGKPLEWMAIVLVFSEFVAVAIFTVALRRSCKTPMGTACYSVLFVSLVALGATVLDGLMISDIQALGVSAMYMLVVVGTALLLYPDLRLRLGELIQERRGGGSSSSGE